MNPQNQIERSKIRIEWWQAVIAGIIPIIALLNYLSTQSPSVKITNHLGTKVAITINDEYAGQVGPKSSREFDLLSSANFPATVEWEIVRQKNDQNRPVGSIMQDVIKTVDNGKNISITNVTTDKKYYFAPLLSNKTGLICKITVNKGKKGIEREAGYLNPYKSNVFIGYYEWIDASNVVLDCTNGQSWYWGDLKGKRIRELRPEAKTGITYLTLFFEENQ